MLTVLNLSSNKIYEADKFFSNSLERLSLKNNCIKKVPTSIFSAASLLVLDMSENELASIPKEILDLFFLKELCVQHNNFAGFPAVICEVGTQYSLVLVLVHVSCAHSGSISLPH